MNKPIQIRRNISNKKIFFYCRHVFKTNCFVNKKINNGIKYHRSTNVFYVNSHDFFLKSDFIQANITNFQIEELSRKLVN